MCSQTLIDLCLDTIVSNFPRYNLAFTITEDDNIKRRFEFLQRKYSFDILSRLTDEGRSLEEQYVDLLINRYLKVLDTSWLENCSWEKVTSKIAEIGSNIEKIVLRNINFGKIPVQKKDEDDIICYLPNAWEDVICHLPNLKYFTYRDNCNYLIFKNVAKFCPNIEKIDIGDASSVFQSQESVKRLCVTENGEAWLTKLKILCFTQIIFEDLKILIKNLPSLEIVDYPFLPLVLHSLFEKGELHSLGNVRTYNITSLDFRNCVDYPYYNDILKVCLSICPHLKSLTYGLLKDDELMTRPVLSKLEELQIMNVTASEVNIDKLVKSRGRNLTVLRIGSCAVSWCVIAKSCPRLKELDLCRAHFLADDDSKPVSHTLTSFTFRSCDSGTRNDRAISLLLSSSPKLESLSFEVTYLLSSDVTADILKCCEVCPIKSVSFSDSRVDADYIKNLLFSCHTLSSLNIDGCFSAKHSTEIIQLAETLPNKPKIFVHIPPTTYQSDVIEIVDDSDGDSVIEIDDSDADGVIKFDDSDADGVIKFDDSDADGVIETDDSDVDGVIENYVSDAVPVIEIDDSVSENYHYFQDDDKYNYRVNNIDYYSGLVMDISDD